MILRLLLIAIALVVLLRLLGWTPPLSRKSGSSQGPNLDSDQGVQVNLVICAQCGVSVPRGTALPHQGRWYCCAEHRDSSQ